MSDRAGRIVRAVGAPVAVALLALLAVAPALIVPGIVATRAGGDSPFLLQRVYEMAIALRGGHFPPRWMPDAAYGLGYPFWNYYAPLAYLFAGTIAVLGGGVIGAVKLTQALCFVLAALGAYKLSRATWGTAAAGVVAAAAYTFAPYHLLNVYVRGDALGELAAYAVAPWLILGLDAVILRPSAKAVARLAVASAAMVLSHNISALLITPVAFGFALWRWWQRRREGAAQGAEGGRRGAGSWASRADQAPAGAARPVPVLGRAVAPGADRSTVGIGGAGGVDVTARWVAGTDDALATLETRAWRALRTAASPAGAVLAATALGAGIAAWFWAPAILEQGAVQLAGNTSGYFAYRNHFLAVIDLSRWLGPRPDTGTAMGLLRSLVTGTPVFDWAPWVRYGTDAGVPATTGIVLLVLALAGAALAWRMHARRGTVRFWGGVALAATVMTTALSWPLWAVLEPLAWVQFPWRLLNVQALGLAMLAGALGALPPPRARWRWAAALGASAAVAAAGLGALRVEVLSIGQPTRADLAAFELFSGNIGTTVRAEYLPWAVDPRPAASVHTAAGVRVGPRALSGVPVGAALVREGVASQTWQVDVGGDQPATLAWPILWFPGWLAAVDGDPPRATRALDGSGWLSLDVPPGRHVVVVSLGRTPVRALAEVLSLVALMLTLILALASGERLRHGRWALGAVVALGVAVAVARALPVGASIGLVTMDWPRMPYPHANPGGLRFGDGRLTAARFEGQPDLSVPLDAGSTLSVALDWTAPAPGSTVTLSLVSPAEAQLGAPEDWASTREPLTATLTAALSLPAELPSGLWFVRLSVTDAAGEAVPAVNAAGHALEAVYLGPVRVRAIDRPAAAAPSASGPGPVLDGDAVALDGVRWSQAGEGLTVRLTWRAKRALTADLKTSVRLMRGGTNVTGADGTTPVQDDKVPGYGFNPPTAWPVGQAVEDRRWLRLPPGLGAGDDYALQVVLYDAWTHAELGTGTVEGVVIAAVPTAVPTAVPAAPAPTPDSSE